MSPVCQIDTLIICQSWLAQPTIPAVHGKVSWLANLTLFLWISSKFWLMFEACWHNIKILFNFKHFNEQRFSNHHTNWYYEQFFLAISQHQLKKKICMYQYLRWIGTADLAMFLHTIWIFLTGSWFRRKNTKQ